MSKLLHAAILCATLTGLVYAETEEPTHLSQDYPTISEHAPDSIKKLCSTAMHTETASNHYCRAIEKIMYCVEHYNKNPDDLAVKQYCLPPFFSYINKETGLPGDWEEQYYVNQLSHYLWYSSKETIQCLRDFHETLLRLKEQSQAEANRKAFHDIIAEQNA